MWAVHERRPRGTNPIDFLGAGVRFFQSYPTGLYAACRSRSNKTGAATGLAGAVLAFRGGFQHRQVLVKTALVPFPLEYALYRLPCTTFFPSNCAITRIISHVAGLGKCLVSVVVSPAGGEMNRLRKALSVKVSSLVTTNLPFDEWTDVFGSGAAHRSAAGPAHPPGPYPGNERRQLPPQGQPAGRHRIVCTGAGWRVALPWPSAHGARSHANAKIRAVTHYPGGTLSLRHSGMFCRCP